MERTNPADAIQRLASMPTTVGAALQKMRQVVATLVNPRAKHRNPVHTPTVQAKIEEAYRRHRKIRMRMARASRRANRGAYRGR